MSNVIKFHGAMRPDANGGKTGSRPGLLQDDSLKLTNWFASRVDARHTVRRVCNEIADQLADEQTREVRRKHDNAHTGLGPISRPSVIYLNNSALAKVLRWIFRSDK